MENFILPERGGRPKLISLLETTNHMIPLDPRVEGSTGWRCWKAVNAFVRVSKHDFMHAFERHVVHRRDPSDDDGIGLDAWLVEESLNEWLDEMEGQRADDEIWLVSSALINDVWHLIEASMTHPFDFNEAGVMWLPHPSDIRFYDGKPHLQAAFGMAIAEAYLASLNPESFSMTFGI